MERRERIHAGHRLPGELLAVAALPDLDLQLPSVTGAVNHSAATRLAPDRLGAHRRLRSTLLQPLHRPQGQGDRHRGRLLRHSARPDRGRAERDRAAPGLEVLGVELLALAALHGKEHFGPKALIYFPPTRFADQYTAPVLQITPGATSIVPKPPKMIPPSILRNPWNPVLPCLEPIPVFPFT